ncbi:MAG: hypothetical protein H6Q33_2856 [Deltaproteobacteria bacterium]|jgi:SAM-dependent methyltransferase|nr:hypothetical protein [Deltaproteobacteria bacterium]
MHPRIYAELERICSRRGAGGAVLEIGAVPSEHSLLCLRCLSAAREKIGISLDGPSRYRDFEILRVNSNAMDCFPERHFDTILCASTLEHDPFFWKTLAELRRVAKPGALVVIGVPGYAEDPARWRRVIRMPLHLPVIGSLMRRGLAQWLASTPTLVPHNCPGDYYRFSRQAVEQVICAAMDEVEIRTLMIPPRIIASGFMP